MRVGNWKEIQIKCIISLHLCNSLFDLFISTAICWYTGISSARNQREKT